MPDLPGTLITPRNTEPNKPSPAQLKIIIDQLITKVLKGALGLTVETEKDTTGITIRINY